MHDVRVSNSILGVRQEEEAGWDRVDQVADGANKADGADPGACQCISNTLPIHIDLHSTEGVVEDRDSAVVELAIVEVADTGRAQMSLAEEEEQRMMAVAPSQVQDTQFCRPPSAGRPDVVGAEEVAGDGQRRRGMRVRDRSTADWQQFRRP